MATSSTHRSISIIQAPTCEPRLSRGRTCSFLEPIKERRSTSGKPYTLPRKRTPAPETLDPRYGPPGSSSSVKSAPMLVRANSLSKQARSFFSRANSTTVYTNPSCDMETAKAWTMRDGAGWSDMTEEMRDVPMISQG
ncbi:hypothetical protein EK21DRAFT_69385 [Setomelanomma holmii]|uniref:Uncharacterized protein n=1 Tax=Setomelanomma holmii TaxID=210430 RepID=A0A9P4LLG3_9PLEO|nr:hypothetical protein EK21DRAFT_69385 [Setomelanomma holmii]